MVGPLVMGSFSVEVLDLVEEGWRRKSGANESWWCFLV